ncbi:MAG: hypothetical protein HY903_01650 [Deltaproteobacteria bacterium]|nr:hypothetical protein [Deltaproteobacteria bacterium]
MSGTAYPLFVDDQRTLLADYAGNVFVWDVDKTYLSTHFSSVRGLLRIPIEFAVDKRAIPGMPEVLRGLRYGPGAHYACVPLYFLTASPRQLHRVLAHKMMLDGVEHDGIIFKDWTKAVLGLRPGRLREQVGFKLAALLTTRARRPNAVEYLFGDDTEADAEAFYLYAEILSGRLKAEEQDRAMAQAGVAADDRACVAALVRQLPPHPKGSVGRAFIHLEQHTPPSFFDKYRGLVTPVAGAFQLALCLFDLDLVAARTVVECGRATAAANPSWDREAQLTDARERGLVSASKLEALGR